MPYRLPIAVIQDPVCYLPESPEKRKSSDKPEEKTLTNIKIRNHKYHVADVVVEISNLAKISDLKATYVEIANKDFTTD